MSDDDHGTRDPARTGQTMEKEAAGGKVVSPDTFFEAHPAARLCRIATPAWENRHPDNLPLLSDTHFGSKGPLPFGGSADRLASFAFVARPRATVKYVGVAATAGKAPSAYLLAFRHTPQAKDFGPQADSLLTLGIGDYLEGRMQLSRQARRSGKNVAVVVPIAGLTSGSVAGEFESDPGFVEQAILDIDEQLFGQSRKDVPLLVACNSDGILPLGRFVKNCGRLLGRVKGAYDLDGGLVLRGRHITLTELTSARVFRYTQRAAVAGDGTADHLALGSRPIWVPLPYERWEKHGSWRRDLQDKLSDRREKGVAANQIRDWLHYHIVTCMLTHGLANTDGL